ncbi:MAG TPA: hypothetical protein VJJ82_03360 [Candidatus Nanoarchaeia archaeon]|nr:hypothetical protein [Candidatus Nanoarchaeia archaeon]
MLEHVWGIIKEVSGGMTFFSARREYLQLQKQKKLAASNKEERVGELVGQKDAAGNFTAPGEVATLLARELAVFRPIIALTEKLATAQTAALPAGTTIPRPPDFDELMRTAGGKAAEHANAKNENYYEQVRPVDEFNIKRQSKVLGGYITAPILAWCALAEFFTPVKPYTTFGNGVGWLLHKTGSLVARLHLANSGEHQIEYRPEEQYQIQVKLDGGKAWCALRGVPAGSKVSEVQVVIPYQGATVATPGDKCYPVESTNPLDSAKRISGLYDLRQAADLQAGRLASGKARHDPTQTSALWNEIAGADGNNGNLTDRDYDAVVPKWKDKLN